MFHLACICWASSLSNYKPRDRFFFSRYSPTGILGIEGNRETWICLGWRFRSAEPSWRGLRGRQPPRNRRNTTEGAAAATGGRKRLLQSLHRRPGAVSPAEPKILEIPKHLSGITPPGTAVSALNQVSHSHKGRRRAPLSNAPHKCIAAEASLSSSYFFFSRPRQARNIRESDSNFPLLIKASLRAEYNKTQQSVEQTQRVFCVLDVSSTSLEFSARIPKKYYDRR